MDNQIFPVFAINLKKRTDRRQHLLKEFEGREEFCLTIIEACEHEIGAIGLWNSIRHILQDYTSTKEEFIIICEDDHQFTKYYSKELLSSCIEEAKQLEADILLGGLSWMNSLLRHSQMIYWVDKFSGLQFTIVFRSFFNTILESEFSYQDAADFKISNLSQKKFLIHPFISTQKGFNYSDVTPKNNLVGRVGELFEKASNRISILDKVWAHYNSSKPINSCIVEERMEDICIPTYVINLSGEKERRIYVESQFTNKSEFNVIIVDGSKQSSTADNLWLYIREIIKGSINKDEDVIVICQDDHTFTSEYAKDILFTHILEAHQQGADLLIGGTGSFGFAIPIWGNRFWVSECLHSTFLIIYKKFFQNILKVPFDSKSNANILMSEMTPNKMLIYPFISVPKGLKEHESLHKLFDTCQEQLTVLKNASLKYQLQNTS